MTPQLQIDMNVRLDSFKITVDDFPGRQLGFATVRLEPSSAYEGSVTLFVQDHTEALMLAAGLDKILDRRERNAEKAA